MCVCFFTVYLSFLFFGFLYILYEPCRVVFLALFLYFLGFVFCILLHCKVSQIHLKIFVSRIKDMCIRERKISLPNYFFLAQVLGSYVLKNNTYYRVEKLYLFELKSVQCVFIRVFFVYIK